VSRRERAAQSHADARFLPRLPLTSMRRERSQFVIVLGVGCDESVSSRRSVGRPSTILARLRSLLRSTRQPPIPGEESLVGHPCRVQAAVGSSATLLELNELMEACAPRAPGQHAAGELVDDLDPSRADDIVDVAAAQMKRNQRLAPELFAPRRNFPAARTRSRLLSQPPQGWISYIRPLLAFGEKKIDLPHEGLHIANARSRSSAAVPLEPSDLMMSGVRARAGAASSPWPQKIAHGLAHAKAVSACDLVAQIIEDQLFVGDVDNVGGVGLPPFRWRLLKTIPTLNPRKR
jgi:hypothetical protein